MANETTAASTGTADAPLAHAFHRTIWRWHFYAGMFVMPFVLILSITGAIYLFKPQIDRWQERAYHGLPTANAVTPSAQRDAAMRAVPGGRFDFYRLPETVGDAPMVQIAMRDGTKNQVFVSPQGKVLGVVPAGGSIASIVHKIHGELFAGKLGSWTVELAGSWAIVMVLTGLYLWWPAGRGLAGVVWPRLRGGKKVFWRDLHAVTGFWVSGFALVLLVTAMPWAGVWGTSFKMVREQMGWVKGVSDWKIGAASTAAADPHAEHKGMMMGMDMGPMVQPDGLDKIATIAASQNLPYPVMVKPPGSKDRTGVTTAWTVKTDAQNRPLNVTMTYDPMTGRELSRVGDADSHILDRAVGYGVAWHEGQLFGWINQLVGLLTALGLATLMVSGFVMWRRRKPEGVLGAPTALPARMRGAVAILLLLAAVLPLLAASLIVLWFVERLILPRLPRVSRWLGVVPVSA